ncbi:diguanylate cyclase (GGDEF) domain-containing protein [Ruminococcus sp. YE71]|uniref:sensor domain-containing diguanylate cyclase n=1 Tax=unclassified Ruminococcus TaxID=2608920 RepID=UPI00088F44C2|nr:MULTISPECIES: sensor domain-containing diguanylate cyclase [unclassified Ruminococcus]SDA29802.1 diguanylate cyclase (GGDEF) domain-containing protein [Ruminococcus sp. YE78]SFW48882.1 diguanylate cyclase (GGDEF) domain-containing protein [Ruminococcus sp. YE71]
MPTDHERMLSEIFSVSEEIYKDMSDDVSDTDHTKVFEYITRLGKTLSESDRTSFWKWDKRNHTLWTAAAVGADKIIIPDNTGLVGKALAEKRVIITNDPYSDPDFNSAVDKKTGYVTKSILVMPVADVNGEFIGAYQAINKLGSDGKFGDEDVRRLSLAAVICGIALESETFLDESHHDKLTQLKNRMGFYSDFSKRYLKLVETGKKLSLFICDIDKFKRINDTYGHNAGDEVLKHTAALLGTCCGENDGIYRWGGEEFVMIMTDADKQTCIDKAEEIRVKIMESVCHAEGNDIKLTLSFGVSEFDSNRTIEENISSADEKLYTAKESGRNRVVF